MTKAERLISDNAYSPAVLFYHHTDQWGCFSMFSPHPITLLSPWTFEPVTYRFGESRFQAMKATNQHDHDKIVNCGTASSAKAIGRAITLREDWGDELGAVCWFAMLETAIAKTLQHPKVSADLILTGNRHIYEDSPVDDIWGWRYHADYSGKNLLGKAWMHVRHLIRSVR